MSRLFDDNLDPAQEKIIFGIYCGIWIIGVFGVQYVSQKVRDLPPGEPSGSAKTGTPPNPARSGQTASSGACVQPPGLSAFIHRLKE